MEIILSDYCESLTGMVKKHFGYYIQRRGERYFGARSRGIVPPDGHLRFILACAQLTRTHLIASDIAVSKDELVKAITEAGYMYNPARLSKPAYNAADVLHFQQIWGL